MQQITQQSFQTVTSDEEAMQQLTDAGYASVFDIVRQSEAAFCQQVSVMPPEQAKGIHAQAKQRVESLSSIIRAYRSRNEPILQGLPKMGINPRPAAMADAVQRSLGGAPDFSELFPERSEDGYADLSSIQSLFSPGRYLTELYKIAKGLHAADSPLHIEQRRPDLETLILSEENMLKELSTLDILIDVLKAGIKKADSAVTMASLETTYFPMTLPYHDNLVQIRSVLASHSSSQQQLWAILADYQARCFAPLPEPSPPTDPEQNVTTPSPAAREALLLTPATYQLLVGNSVNADIIQRDYGLASNSIHTELQSTSVFCAQTGLTFNQLLEMTGQADPQASSPNDPRVSRFYKQAIGTAVPVTEFGQSYVATSGPTLAPLLMIPSETSDAPADLNLDAANAVMLADRAERLIRLQQATRLEFHQLDWLIKNANLAYSPSRATSLLLDTPVIEAIAEFQHLNEAYALSVDAFASFIGEVNSYALQYTPSFYRQLFTSSSDATTVPLGITVDFTPLVSNAYASTIAGALGVTPNELWEMATLAFDNPAAALWTTQAAGQLYRQAMIPRMLGITYFQARQLWKMLNPGRDIAQVVAGQPTLETLAIIRQTEAVLQWMNSHQLDIEFSLSLTTSQYSENVTPELYNFVDNIYTTLNSDSASTATLSDELRQKLYRLTSAVFKIKANVMGRLITWIDATFTTEAAADGTSGAYGLGDFWAEIDGLFRSGADSIFEELYKHPNIVRYSQAMAQYALISRWASLTEQDLSLIVDSPSSLATEDSATLGMSLLLDISRLKEWQQRTAVTDAEAMSYFHYANQANQTADVAVAMLARIFGWDLQLTQEMNTTLVGRGLYLDFPKTLAELLQLEAWMQVSHQTTVGCEGIDGVYQMSLEVPSAEQPLLIQKVAEAFAATLSRQPVGTATAPVALDVTVSGEPMVGNTLTGSYHYIDAEGDAEGMTLLQWHRTGGYGGGVPGPIEEATGSTYLLTRADEGATIQFAVTPVASMGTPTAGYEQRSVASAAIAPKSGARPTAGGVLIQGVTSVGSTVEAIYGYSDVDGDEEAGTTFQWYRTGEDIGDEPIEGAVNSTYLLVAADRYLTIKVGVTPVARTGDPKLGNEQKSAATPVIEGEGVAPVASNVTVTGRPDVGQTLWGNYSYSDGNGDLEGDSQFFWGRQLDPILPIEIIPNATQQSYVLTEADIGYYVIFNVTPIAISGTPNRGGNNFALCSDRVKPRP